ncbi:ABC transporter substrate-binding protein [Leucobacter chromiireducens]|uniref:Branched-chain amino acid ABC transporter substrate-binding protein n=1 Tax=Leucobacter chromiireducens subsp. chromiireducens TaxID=660067 RepID=A0ABS1SQ56_9MICO|nr:ABC transporter substrate-binding protein [Leucobacter chromiireducens]MBL3690316.1 branched-chain amino acid ABC transporter substrate-binding protein [Leucobacter chromiireducens subsp. chromiireducens]
MSYRRRAALALTAGAALIALSACSSGDSGAGGEGGADGAIPIGYTATLSGDFASYGLEMREGIDLAISEINADGGVLGRDLTTEVVDDEGKPANGPVIAQEMCDNSEIPAVLGFSFSSVALSGLPIYTQCGLPIVAAAVTSPELSGASDIFFRTVFTDAYQGAEAASFISEHRGVKKIAILYQQDDYGKGVADSFTEAFEAAGGTVTSSQAYQLGTVNFGSTVDAALKDQPDAVFIGGFYTEAGKIVNQVRDAGSDLPIFASDGAASPLFLDLAGANAEGVEVYAAFSASDPRPESAKFVEAFQAQYNKDPSSWAALAYDATYIAAEGITEAGSTDRAAVADAIRKTDGYAGASGTISFDDEGNRVGELTFQRVEDGKFVVITE